MFNKYIIALLLVFNTLCFKNLAQNKDSIEVRKLFFKAEDFEASNPDSAIFFYKKIVTNYSPRIKNKFIGACYHRIAQLEFDKTNDFKKYFETNFKALAIFEAIHDSASAMVVYQNQAIALTRQNRFNEAITDLIKIRNYATNHKDTSLLVSIEMLIAESYSSLSKSDTAIAILLNLEKKYISYLSTVARGNFYSNLGNLYYNWADVGKESGFLKAIEYANKALQLFEIEFDDPSDKSFVSGLIGAAYMKLGKHSVAESYYVQAIKIEEEQNNITELNTLYFEMTELQIKLANKSEALKYFFKHDSIAKLIYNENNASSISEMKTLFETEKKEKENKELLLKNELSSQTIKQQQIITLIVVIGLILLSIFAFFIFKGLKQQRKANVIIAKQKQEVEHQKQIVEEHQKEIVDSIHYAKRIQNTLLAHEDFINHNIPHNFILFKPKDIVSGDFYWATKHENTFYLAVCDSTGHGVPGAFMSLLNINFLNEAINEKGILEPHCILNYVRERLVNSVSKDGQKDGFDGILLCFNTQTKSITYSAAHNAPILISDGVLHELPKDKMPVGAGELKEDFKLHAINAKPGDVLYLYTDGYADQFGGEKGKKFKYKPLNDLLLRISCEDMITQQKTLDTVITDWKGSLEQVDDICVIGIKV